MYIQPECFHLSVLGMFENLHIKGLDTDIIKTMIFMWNNMASIYF